MCVCVLQPQRFAGKLTNIRLLTSLEGDGGPPNAFWECHDIILQKKKKHIILLLFLSGSYIIALKLFLPSNQSVTQEALSHGCYAELFLL